MNKINKKDKNTASEAATELGRLGGKALTKKHGKSYMKEIGKRGSEARWGKNRTKKK